jgi:hypothetical protein
MKWDAIVCIHFMNVKNVLVNFHRTSMYLIKDCDLFVLALSLFIYVWINWYLKEIYVTAWPINFNIDALKPWRPGLRSGIISTCRDRIPLG